MSKTAGIRVLRGEMGTLLDEMGTLTGETGTLPGDTEYRRTQSKSGRDRGTPE